MKIKAKKVANTNTNLPRNLFLLRLQLKSCHHMDIGHGLKVSCMHSVRLHLFSLSVSSSQLQPGANTETHISILNSFEAHIGIIIITAKRTLKCKSCVIYMHAIPGAEGVSDRIPYTAAASTWQPASKPGHSPSILQVISYTLTNDPKTCHCHTSRVFWCSPGESVTRFAYYFYWPESGKGCLCHNQTKYDFCQYGPHSFR